MKEFERRLWFASLSNIADCHCKIALDRAGGGGDDASFDLLAPTSVVSVPRNGKVSYAFDRLATSEF